MACVFVNDIYIDKFGYLIIDISSADDAPRIFELYHELLQPRHDYVEAIYAANSGNPFDVWGVDGWLFYMKYDGLWYEFFLTDAILSDSEEHRVRLIGYSIDKGVIFRFDVVKMVV